MKRGRCVKSQVLVDFVDQAEQLFLRLLRYRGWRISASRLGATHRYTIVWRAPRMSGRHRTALVQRADISLTAHVPGMVA